MYVIVAASHSSWCHNATPGLLLIVYAALKNGQPPRPFMIWNLDERHWLGHSAHSSRAKLTRRSYKVKVRDKGYLHYIKVKRIVK